MSADKKHKHGHTRSGGPDSREGGRPPRHGAQKGRRADHGDAAPRRRYTDGPGRFDPRSALPATDLGLVGSWPLAVPEDARHLVSVLMDIIEESVPMPAGHRQDLRRDVLELWRELTSEKQERKADYIGEPAKLAAYLRYFLPWNVVRLIPILASLDLRLVDGDSVLDIGSGPLTLPIALYIARPELRNVALRVVAMDRVRRVLDAGAAVLDGLRLRSGKGRAWTVETRRGVFPFDLADGDAGAYAFLGSANVFNESFWKGKGRLDERAFALAGELTRPLRPGGRALVVEPGDPRTGAMIASLREAVLRSDGSALAPCPHAAACPMPGAFLSSAFRRDDEDEDTEALNEAPPPPLERVVTARGRVKAPWCHFALPQDAAPERLEKFSESVGLPKDRLVASYLYFSAAKASAEASPRPLVRIVSDPFRLPDGGQGRYACCRSGYTLARGGLADLPSGTLAELGTALPGMRGERDAKSGAVVVRAYPADGVALASAPSAAPATPSPKPGSPPRRSPEPRRSESGPARPPRRFEGSESGGRRSSEPARRPSSPYAPKPGPRDTARSAPDKKYPRKNKPS